MSDIKIINDQAQVQQVTYTDELCLRIQFMKETVYLAFSGDPEETMLQWILEINKLLGSTAIIPPPKPPKEKKRLFARKRTDPADNLKKVIPAADEPAPKPSVEKVHTVAPDHTDDSQLASQPKQTKTSQSSKDRFCMNCGNKLSPGTIFCPVCGFKVTSTKDSATAEPTPPAPPASSVPPAPPTGKKVNRVIMFEKVETKYDSSEDKEPTNTCTRHQQEYAGKVLKCPSCGAELPSMIAICPTCGHEINSARTHPVLAQFIASLEECDRLIAEEEKNYNKENGQKKDGWSTWGKGKKFLWVILNLYFACIPLIIYLIYRAFYRKKSLLNPYVARKESLIENYQVPNEKEIILESLYFIEAKINSLSDKVITPDNWRWMSLWNSKAEQIYGKARILLPDDQTLDYVHQNIEKKVDSGRKIITVQRMLILIAIIISVIWFLWRMLRQ